jgi:NTP pyrophosphatase (non-canonical NTP hydrolase)
MSQTSTSTDSVRDLTRAVQAFVSDRDWEQFHGVKNLAIALSVEAGEVLEHVLWKDSAALEELLASDPSRRQRLEGELGDVFMCLLGLFDRLGADPGETLLRKLAETAEKYPVEAARGCSSKYSELDTPGGD